MFLSCKNGDGVREGGGVLPRWKLSVEGGDKHSFLLIMYGFRSKNALYLASLSFRMFIFILTPFNI